eukprot:CAMPEP_0182847676 /NCGR_PEP_ID=MMETSP0006_2-20121128/28584_1 /TAXON_ID=97485 /ORGANISM="Prymnesium parvum, Strain Texoma1" /LENGTH=297 /DNA_ID=CAMNT_0024978023 /DNA_START=300 /DNA_END=1190 /DNA_ORIENTATION=-
MLIPVSSRHMYQNAHTGVKGSFSSAPAIWVALEKHNRHMSSTASLQCRRQLRPGVRSGGRPPLRASRRAGMPRRGGGGLESPREGAVHRRGILGDTDFAVLPDVAQPLGLLDDLALRVAVRLVEREVVQLPHRGGEARLLLRVDERAVLLERRVRVPHRDRRGEAVDPAVLEQLARRVESPQPSHRPWRGGDDHGDLPLEGVVHPSFAACGPRDGVHQRGGGEAVVLRAGAEEAIRLGEVRLEPLRAFGECGGLEVLTEQREAVVLEVELEDGGAARAEEGRRVVEQLRVERADARG